MDWPLMACPAKFRGRTNQPIHQANACGNARDAEFEKLQAGIAGMRRLFGEQQRAAGAARAAGTRGMAGGVTCIAEIAPPLAAVAGEFKRASCRFSEQPSHRGRRLPGRARGRRS